MWSLRQYSLSRRAVSDCWPSTRYSCVLVFLLGWYNAMDSTTSSPSIGSVGASGCSNDTCQFIADTVAECKHLHRGDCWHFQWDNSLLFCAARSASVLRPNARVWQVSMDECWAMNVNVLNAMERRFFLLARQLLVAWYVIALYNRLNVHFV